MTHSLPIQTTSTKPLIETASHKTQAGSPKSDISKKQGQEKINGTEKKRADYHITKIQLFFHTEGPNVEWYSAKIVINDEFIVMVSGDAYCSPRKNQASFDGIHDESICFWRDREKQDEAKNNIDDAELEYQLIQQGFKNSYEWLKGNELTEHMGLWL